MIHADTLHRATLLHLKMTEAGFPLTEINEDGNTLTFGFAGPKFILHHTRQGEDETSYYGRTGKRYRPPTVVVGAFMTHIRGNLNDENQCTVFNEGTPSDLTGRFAEQVSTHMRTLDSKRTEANRIMSRLNHMTRFLGDTEHDWPKRNACAIWELPGSWNLECDSGKLIDVPFDLVLSTREQLEKIPRQPKDKLRLLETFRSEVSWARHILSLELPVIPKVPRKFRSFAETFNSFRWTELTPCPLP